jgi:hypothetical protein
MWNMGFAFQRFNPYLYLFMTLSVNYERIARDIGGVLFTGWVSPAGKGASKFSA